MRTALDTNVISALWSQESIAPQLVTLLGRAQAEGGLAICAPVYAELAAHPKTTFVFLKQFLTQTNIKVDFLLDEEVWRLASQTFADYAKNRRESGGKNPKRFLADFIIGAHAMLRADRLFTLDKSRYENAFPHLRLLL